MAVPFVPRPRTAAQRDALAEAREHQARVDAKAPKGGKWAPYASKAELMFAVMIDGLIDMEAHVVQFQGTIIDVVHQPCRWYLIKPSDGAKGVSYRPDFRLRLAHDDYEWTAWVEVKPAKRLRTERDGIVRAQVAAEMMPWDRWYIARLDGSAWEIKRIGPVTGAQP